MRRIRHNDEDAYIEFIENLSIDLIKLAVTVVVMGAMLELITRII